MAPVTNARPRVEGTLTDDGRVLCVCGKRVGGIEEGKAVFACSCGNLVTIDSDILLIRACHDGISTCNNAINQVGRMVDALLARRRDA